MPNSNFWTSEIRDWQRRYLHDSNRAALDVLNRLIERERHAD